MNEHIKKEKILITGATGMLGVNLSQFLLSRGHNVFLHGNSKKANYQADLTNSKVIKDIIFDCKPSTVINLVGLTNVDECELDISKAYLINTKVIENLAKAIKSINIETHLIQISTDQLYDGKGLFSEQFTSIRNNYAISKYAGEMAAQSVDGSILRVNFFGKSRVQGRLSFTDWIYHSLSNNKKIRVFDDVLFSPLSLTTLSEQIELVVKKKPKGIFNLGSREGMSKAKFAFAFARLVGLPGDLMEESSVDSISSIIAYRPRNMTMNCNKFENEFGVVLPKLINEIERVVEEYV